jgi:dienelactone hydrolase
VPCGIRVVQRQAPRCVEPGGGERPRAPRGVAGARSRDGHAPWVPNGPPAKSREGRTWTLVIIAGTLLAAVIVHGSGPLDRDGTVGERTPYADLAAGLAARGVAVLRYDKRTFAHRAEMAAARSITVADETVDDAVAAVERLRASDGIDPTAVFVIGHSLGGYLGPRVLRAAPAARGLIVLAGNTRPLPRVILEQTAYLASLGGTPPPEVEQALAAMRRGAELAESPELSDSTPVAELPSGVPASYWLDLRDYDPAALAAELDRPLFIVRGDRDYQVTEADMDGWRAGLAGPPDVTFRTYRGLDHTFAAGAGPATPQDYLRPGHVADAVIDDVATWIASRSGATPD